MVRPFPVITLSFLAVLIVLLSVDVFFVVADIIAFIATKLALIAKIPDIIKITRDGALPEIYGYVEWAVIILSLLWLAVRERWLAPVRWALVFVIVLVDDSIQIHETVGFMLTEHLALPVSLQAQSQDIAEVLVFGAMGLIAVALTASMFFSHDPHTLALSKRLGLVILFLIVFGVILDFVHQIVITASGGTIAAQFLPAIFSMIEDGGEMIVASFAAAFVLTLPGLEPLNTAGRSAHG
jgi:hypothetical protein